MALSEKTIEIVKATAPVVGANALEITQTFYPILFKDFPETKAMFNQSHQKSSAQPRALADAIVAYALNIDKLENLGGAVEAMSERHASLNIRPEHYPMVGQSLIKAIGIVLEDVITDEIVDAWTEAYFFLADLLISVEKGKYQKTKDKVGGWEGYKDFTIAKKEQESPSVCSFYLKPADGAPTPTYEAGQYISIQIQTEEFGTTVRNYSLSSAHDTNHFRISVKEDGLVSTKLHKTFEEGDTIKVNPPYGLLTLKENENDIVLISGGIGVTPMLSMLEELSEKKDQKKISFIKKLFSNDTKSSTKVHFINANISEQDSPFKARVQEICKKHENFSSYFFYEEEPKMIGDDFVGRISPEFLREAVDLKNSEFYLCGPAPMMKALHQGLSAKGVDSSRINYEFFGPAEAMNH